MSGADKKLDAFLKGKLEQVQHPYDAAHWEAAAQMLDQKGPAGKPPSKRWPWLFLLLIPVTILLLGVNYQRHQPPLAQTCGDAHINPRMNQGQLALGSAGPSLDKSSVTQPQKKENPEYRSVSPKRNATLKKEWSNEVAPGMTRQASHFQSRDIEAERSRNKSVLAWEFERIAIPESQASSMGSLDQEPIIYRTLNRQPKFSLGLFGDWGYAQPLDMNGRGADKVGWGATIGLDLSWQIQRRIQLRVGAGILQRCGLAAEKSFVQESFDFGLNRKTISIAPERAFYLNVPFQLRFAIAPRHRLQAGVEFWQLIDVRSQEKTETTVNGGPGNAAEQALWGYSQGFNSQNWNLMAGYSAVLAPRLELGLNLRYGLSDLSNDAYFERSAIDRNVQIMISLHYDLFRF